MMRYRMKPYAPVVLLVAMLFAFGNVAHSIEHDYVAGSGQSHAECNHCSVELTAAVNHVAVSTFAPLQAVHPALIVSRHVAFPFSTFQARAPPLS